MPSNIFKLRTLPAPARPPVASRVNPVEDTVYSVSAILLRYKYETDSDVHLVIADTGGRTMIAEIPAPQCVGASSPFLPSIRYVRRKFTSQFHPSTTWQRVHIPIQIAGVGFFDFKHGQSGVAPNAIELHPVLRFSVGAGNSPPPPAPPASKPQPTIRPSGSFSVRAAVSPNPVSYMESKGSGGTGTVTCTLRGQRKSTTATFTIG